MSGASLSLLLIAMQVATIRNDATQEPPQRSGAGDGDRIVCVRSQITGSLLRQSRICRTRAEWASIQAENQDLVERTTARKPFPAISCRREQGC